MVNANANNHQHWTQVYCGHEIQINESLTGGGPNPSSDPIKTGSVYGFRNLNAKQSGTYERLTKGVWHQYEIRTIGQQYTIMIDGKIINQFDNSIPKVNTRNGDPPTMARQFTQGYLGLQTHGGTDRISYREIQVKDIAPADIPVNTAAPSVTRLRLPGQPADLQPRHVERRPPGTEYFVKWYRSNKILPTNPRFRAPSATDTGQLHDAGRPDLRHAGADVDGLAAGRRERDVHADRRGHRQGHPLRGQRQQRRRHGVEDRGRPGDPLGDQRRRLRRRQRCRPR